MLARTINGLLRDEVGENKAGKIGYLLGVFLKSLEINTLENRINEIEERVNRELGDEDRSSGKTS